MLKSRLEEKNMTAYRCAKQSGIPYATLHDLLDGKTQLSNCSAHTLYQLAKVLDTTMEELLLGSGYIRTAFETFKSQTCHQVKELGDIDFIVHTLRAGDVIAYWKRRWYPECFYILAMLDYLCRMHDLPICENYSEIRAHSLKEPLYPSAIALMAKIDKKTDWRQQCVSEAIPEFLRFNIIEGDIRDVC